MIRIGEKLNSSIPATQKMLESRDQEAVVALIEKQAQAGPITWISTPPFAATRNWKPCSG